MPGPTITRLLQPYNQQSFYRVARQLHYELIRRETNAVLEVDLALKAIDYRLGPFFATSTERADLQAALFELSEALNELVNFTRHSDYRCHRGEDFSPYDTVMWDIFFNEISHAISTRIQRIRHQVGQLGIPELTLPPDVDHRPLRILQTLGDSVETYLSEVEVLLDAGNVELWIEHRNPA